MAKNTNFILQTGTNADSDNEDSVNIFSKFNSFKTLFYLKIRIQSK
jgi:hypothetical protein